MATAWKKVALSSDIPVGVGGTATSGPGSAQHDVLIQGLNGEIESQALAENQVLIGTNGGAPTVKAFGMGDVQLGTGDASNIELNIESGAVDTLQLAGGAVTLAKLADSDFVGGEVAGGIVYWSAAVDTEDTGEVDTNGDAILANGATHQKPQLLEPGEDGQVLTIETDEHGNANPVWAAASAAADTIAITASTATGAINLLMGEQSDNNNVTADKIYVDNNNLTYDRHTTGNFSHGTNASADNGSAGLYSAKGFKGNLSGVASGANKIKTTAATDSNTYYLPMVQSNSAQSLEDLQTGTHVKYVRGTNAATSTMTIDGSLNIVGDLEIQGSSTVTNIESTQVDIADARIRLSYSDSLSQFSEDLQTAQAGGIGIVVHNGQGVETVVENGDNTFAQQNDESKLARLVYLGHKRSATYTDSKSVLGWALAQETNNGAANEEADTALGDATLYGVGVMHVDESYTMSTAGGNSALDIGIGAFVYGNSGELWIQTDSAASEDEE